MDSNKKNIKKRGIKMIVVPLTAAIAVTATAVGAMAAYQRNLAREYNDVLAQDAEGWKQDYKDAEGNDIAQKDVALSSGLYEELNITLDKTFEYEDFTLEFPGAICDGTNIFVMYNITFNEHLECLDIYGQNFYIFGENRNVSGGTRALNGIFSERSGKTVYSGYIDYTGVENCGEQLNLHFESLRASASEKGREWYRADLDIDLEIPLTGNITRFNKTVKVNNTPHIDLGGWGEWDVTDVEITPLSVKFNTKTDGEVIEGNLFKIASPVFPVNVTFKDGSILDLSDYAISTISTEPEDKTGSFKAIFNYPINVDDVQSVQFASAVISEDGTAKTVAVPAPVDRYTKS